MLSMMEKYAHNLEDLVNERTELLAEEKKMTENLLLRMLPRLSSFHLALVKSFHQNSLIGLFSLLFWLLLSCGSQTFLS